MNKNQKIIVITLVSILILICVSIICVKSNNKKGSNVNQEKINETESNPLIDKYNKIQDLVNNNIEIKEEKSDIIVYRYTGQTDELKKLLSEVYIKPFFKDEVFKLQKYDEKEEIEINLPKNCKLKKIENNRETTEVINDAFTILIGKSSYVVQKDKDNKWKFWIPFTICE